ncbi:MAG: uracil-DNA glycosylase [Christensenellaceae bacterium]|jgi:uracil-DNA glycosylase|nr:uracil-DNA glycosylase [Christensenellaceae bacterium]
MKLTPEWKEFLSEYLKTPQARELQTRVLNEYGKHKVCPPSEKVFSAFDACLPDKVNVVILGQDPYFNAGQAMGMAFSIDPTCKCDFPPSLRNIITEVKSEYGTCNVEDGDLTPWAKQGVLLLNTSLTVRMGAPLSHAEMGWDGLTRSVISALNKRGNIAFVLWGSHAAKYAELITDKSNLVLKCAHPSPLSASRGFFGCGHFKKIDEYLKSLDKSEIVW